MPKVIGYDADKAEQALKRTAETARINAEKTKTKDEGLDPAASKILKKRESDDKTKLTSTAEKAEIAKDGVKTQDAESKAAADKISKLETKLSSLESSAAQQQQQQQVMQQQAMMRAQQQQQQMMQQQAMQQQQAYIQQMNMAAQQALAAKSSTISSSELSEMVKEYLKDDTNSIKKGDLDVKDSLSEGRVEPGKVEEIDVSDVSFDKADGGALSEDQLDNVLNKAMDINGVPDDPEVRNKFLNTWREMSKHESGTNPNAANGWDSNAVGPIQSDGFPRKSSRGLLQCIPETFATNHMSGTSKSIYDPLASAAASVRYTSIRYNIDLNTGEGLESFAGSRGIDIHKGGTHGTYRGY